MSGGCEIRNATRLEVRAWPWIRTGVKRGLEPRPCTEAHNTFNGSEIMLSVACEPITVAYLGQLAAPSNEMIGRTAASANATPDSTPPCVDRRSRAADDPYSRIGITT